MNSEELEQSLRSEFESYLKNVVADMQREAAQFRERMDGEFVQQRARFEEAFGEYSSRLEAGPVFDDAFRGSVAEHLRLARDEGARITADAMVEAEKLQQESIIPAAPPAYDQVRDAVDDIASKDSQSAILKSLVGHASKFAPRGAFFIIKNDHLGGWKTFDSDGETSDSAIRDVQLPVASSSILGSAAQSLRAVSGAGEQTLDNASFLEPLGFGESTEMYAIPLIARGRAVAVLYADQGTENGDVNVDALETLVRVAGLTVELLAVSQSALADGASLQARDPAQPERSETPGYEAPEAVGGFPLRDAPAEISPYAESPRVETNPHGESSFSENQQYQERTTEETPFETSSFDEYRAGEPTSSPTADEFQKAEHVPPFDRDAGSENYRDSFSSTPAAMDEPPSAEPSAESSFESQSKEAQFVFDSGGSIEHAPVDTSPFERTVEPAAAFSSAGYSQAIETPAVQSGEPSTLTPSRRADRPVDLPIEVPDDERRIHNDARRFARLLVSEIKLYNEKKVTEGREAQDLYDRLREAIDRSREMYDKRVQPPVAAKFDYFHYELVNSLADGDASRLGSGYPGSVV